MTKPKNNPVLGTLTCPTCHGEATVHAMKTGYLYTRGCECKLRQGTGRAFQAELFRLAQWAAGVAPVKPKNLTEADYVPGAVAGEPAEVVPASGSSKPRPKPRLVVDNTNAPAKKSPIVGLALVGALIAGIVTFAATRRPPS